MANIKLTLSEDVNAQSYQFEKSTDNINWSVLATQSSNIYTDSAANGTTVYYRGKIIGDGTNYIDSDYSATQTVNVPSPQTGSVRYIRVSAMGSTTNSAITQITEVKAMQGANNLLTGILFTHNATITGGSRAMATDDDLGTFVKLENPTSSVVEMEFDLGQIEIIDSILLSYYPDGRTMHDTKLEVSENGTDWNVVFDSAVDGEYVEPVGGRLFTL